MSEADTSAVPMRLNGVVIDPDPAKLTPEMIKELKSAMYVPPALKVAREAALAMPDTQAPAVAPPAAPASSGAINIDVRAIQQAAKVKAYQDAIAAGKTEAEAQNAEAAAGNLAGADALAQQGQAAGLTTAAEIPAAAPAPAPAAPAKALYKGSVGAQEIQKLNPAIIDVNRIQVGQTLKMPNGQPDYVVKPGDTLDRIAKGVKPAQGAMSANVAPVGQPAATAANAALGTVKGATKAIPTVATPPGNPGGVGKNATYTTDEIAAAREALKDPKISARDKAFYTDMIARQPAPAPATAPAKVMAKPADPMQANIWMRDYGKTHNPDGTPKVVSEGTGYNELERIVSLVHYR
jgi:LysM repeat protein